MSTQVVKRLALLPILLAVVAFVVFALLRAAPGDPAVLILGPDYTPEAAAEVRSRLGLDRPFVVQYASHLRDVATGDFGVSYSTGRPIGPDLWEAARISAPLAGLAIVIAGVVGVLTGVLSAVKQNSVLDSVVRVTVLAGVSMPIFWFGLMLIALFTVRLGLLPAFGWGTTQHMILPAITLATFPLAVIARLTRSSMLEVLKQDYVRTARANGLGPVRVVMKHALKNALVPVVTIIGLQFGALFAGAILTETVFAIPGLGRLTVIAIQSRDYPVVGATVLLGTAVFVTANMVVDVLYTKLNPRIP